MFRVIAIIIGLGLVAVVAGFLLIQLVPYRQGLTCSPTHRPGYHQQKSSN